MYVDVKDLPEPLRGIVRRASGQKNIAVVVRDHFNSPGSYGKGFRGQVVVVNLETGDTQYEVGSWGGANPFRQSPIDSPGGPSPLPPGFAALTAGRKHWTLHLNPANVAKLLPAPAESHELTLREMWLLWTFHARTSAGRKDEWESSRYDNPIGGAPSAGELEQLARKGVISINRAGAAQITTLGRNVIGDVRDYQIIDQAKAAGARSPSPESRKRITAEDLLLPVGVKPVKS